MLTHQIKRINTAAMLVANHMGQQFPVLQRTDLDSKTYDKKYYFDKVLAGNFYSAKKKMSHALAMARSESYPSVGNSGDPGMG
jgi:hypothetical protein